MPNKMATLNLASYAFSYISFVGGYHDYLNIWLLQVGEILEVIAEPLILMTRWLLQ